MDLLKRSLAPVTDEAWEQIDDEARRVLKLHLAGRKVVDFAGPFGWTKGGVNTGRLEHLDKGPVDGVSHAVRDVVPLVEIRAPIRLPILELDYAARGAKDLDLDPVVETAEKVALAEDTAIFHGLAEAKIEGIIDASPHTPITVGHVREFPRALAEGKEVLRLAGINGPYALVAGREAYDALIATSDDGHALRKRIEGNIVDQPIVWAPSIQGGAVLMSVRGGDYELTVGQDLSVGYASSNRDHVELYLTESFAFRVLEDKAAIFIKFGSAVPPTTPPATNAK